MPGVLIVHVQTLPGSVNRGLSDQVDHIEVIDTGAFSAMLRESSPLQLCLSTTRLACNSKKANAESPVHEGK